jgi:hypothetical protein
MDEAGPHAPPPHSDGPDAIAAALRRLSLAIDGLEMAARRQRAMLDAGSRAATEIALMRADRQKLADALDGALARNRALEDLCEQLGARIDRAIGEVRAVLVERG